MKPKNSISHFFGSLLTFFEKEKVEKYKDYWLTTLLCLAVLVGSWAVFAEYDAETYLNPPGVWKVADNLISGKGYSLCRTDYFPFCDENNQATASREPVPVLLTALFILLSPSAHFTVFMQAILYIAVIFIFYYTYRQDDLRLAFLAIFFWITFIPVMNEINTDAGEMIDCFFYALGLLFFFKAQAETKITQYTIAGIFMGLAALSRTVNLGIALILGLTFFLPERRTLTSSLLKRIFPVFMYFLMIGILLSPWIIRNRIVFGSNVIGSTLTGYNIFRMNYYLADEPFQPHYVGGDEALQAVHTLIDQSGLTGTENEAQLDDVYMSAGITVILKNPIRYIMLSVYRFLMLWFNAGVNQSYGIKYLKRDYIMMIQSAILLIGVIIGSLKSIKKNTKYLPLTISVWAGCAAYILVNAQIRYLADLTPALIPLAAFGYLQFFNLFERQFKSN